MARPLPRLRTNLDFMPSPVPDRPGLLIRDPFQYSDATLILPPSLIQCLELFDGQRTELDLRAFLVSLTGDLRVGELVENLVSTLSQAGFLEDENFAAMRRRRHQAFERASAREPSHAGSAYPEDPAALRATLAQWLDGAAPPQQPVVGIAAPHISPDGGWQCYRAAYGALPRDVGDRTFVILGTSHFGEPDRFGLTRKPFRTPLGQTQVAESLVDFIARQAADGVVMEDYCHAVEHSVEFQVVFLQYLYGPDIRILPVLCGSYAQAASSGRPEDSPAVARLLEAFRELAAREGDRLLWVLGVDLAHMGRRYGDPFEARAHQGRMRAVAEADRRRLERIQAGDADGFWELVQSEQDPLKWCGASVFYSFLRIVTRARAHLLRYEQWNIDPASVVSFAALAFSA